MGRCGETRGHSVQLSRQPIIQAGTLFITSLLNRAKTVCGLGAPLSEISTIFGLQQTLLNINDEIIDIKLIYYYLNKIFIGRLVFFSSGIYFFNNKFPSKSKFSFSQPINLKQFV